MNVRDQIEKHIAEGIGAALFTPESERAIIGAILCAPSACADTFDLLQGKHFADGVHARLYAAAQRLHKGGSVPSPAMIRDAMGADPDFAEWGGIDQLWILAETGTISGLSDHVAAVIDRSDRRAIRHLTQTISDRAGDTAKGEASVLLSDLERGAAEIAQGSATADAFITAADMVRNAVAYARSRSGKVDFSFGVREVDEQTGGLNAGEATWLAARTGMGKTVAGQTVARANASAGLGTCFFSLEMAANPLGLRLASDLLFNRSAPTYSAIAGYRSQITADAAMKHLLSAEQWARLDEASAIVDQWPLMIDTRAGLTLAQMEAAARRQHRRWERHGIKPGPVVIDHLGRVRPGKDRRGNRHAEMADISNEASEMAKRLGVPVVGLVQLNRGVEGRDDKRPQLSDLRAAGELEEDARQVIFLYRPEYYLRTKPDRETYEQEIERLEKLKDVERKFYWIVGKNSHGPLGEVLSYCDIGSSAIRSWEP